MRARPYRRRELARFWAVAAGLAALMLVQVSVPGAIAALLALVVLFLVPWWQPLLLGLALVVLAPIAAALGAGSALDDYSVVALALLGIAICLAGLDGRRSA